MTKKAWYINFSKENVQKDKYQSNSCEKIKFSAGSPEARYCATQDDRSPIQLYFYYSTDQATT